MGYPNIYKNSCSHQDKIALGMAVSPSMVDEWSISMVYNQLIPTAHACLLICTFTGNKEREVGLLGVGGEGKYFSCQDTKTIAL